LERCAVPDGTRLGACSALANRWPDRPRRCGIGKRAQRRGAGFEYRLLAYDKVEFLFDLFLIEHLPAGDPVDLRAHVRDTIFVSELHLGLTRDEPGEHVVLK